MDASEHLWNLTLVYLFLPVSPIFKVLNRPHLYSSTVIASIPFWPQRPWFPVLPLLTPETPILLAPSLDFLHHKQFLHSCPAKNTSVGTQFERHRPASPVCSSQIICSLLKPTTSLTCSRYINFALERSFWPFLSPWYATCSGVGLRVSSIKIQI